MQQIRRSKDRGQVDLGWLHSQHSFSFGSYHDPKFMGWGNLRVINEDRVQPGKGFGTHSHRDMEIVSYVLSGELAHKDNMGNASVMAPDDVQRMSAGTGVTHSEYNHAATETTHFLQIWLLPDQQGIDPGYEQVQVKAQQKRGRLHLIASPQGGEQSVQIFSNAKLYAGLFDGVESARLTLDPVRKAYVHVVGGELNVNGHALCAGDALMLSEETALELKDGQKAEVIVFDLEA
jgi:redox-sensitive bicupin YhaK (pirin superfamily)